MKISVNINDYVIIYLTESGKKVYKKHYEDLLIFVDEKSHKEKLDYWMGKIKENGMLKIPFFDLMHIFGKDMFMGNNKLPLFKNNDVEIVNDTQTY